MAGATPPSGAQGGRVMVELYSSSPCRRLASLVALVGLCSGRPAGANAASGIIEPSSSRSKSPQVAQVTDRLVTAIDHFVERGVISAEALAAFSQRYASGAEQQPLRVSDLVPRQAALTAERWAARRLLELYDHRPVLRERVMQFAAKAREHHRQERTAVKRQDGSAVPMDFVRIEPGKIRWRNRTVEITRAFEVQSTPLLTEHWGSLGQPTTLRPGSEPKLGHPFSVWSREIPQLLTHVNTFDPDSRYEYSLISANQWLYLTHAWGNGEGAPWGKKTKKLLEYAWLQENAAEAGVGAPPKRVSVPDYTAPVHDKKPVSVGGQSIWGLFGNMWQLVVPEGGPRLRAPFHEVVGGSLRNSHRHFGREDYLDLWTGHSQWTRGSVRLVRRPKRAGSGKTP